MNLRSRRSLTEAAAKKQITALSDFADGLMRHDTCSEFEPIRTPYDPADISKPFQWLAKPHGEFFYSRKPGTDGTFSDILFCRFDARNLPLLRLLAHIQQHAHAGQHHKQA